MAELAIFLVEHLGPPALIVMFGFVADYVSTKGLKENAVAWLARDRSHPRGPRFGKVLLTSFLSGFLYRIFDRTLTVRFLLRSLIVSMVIFILVIGLQSIYHEEVIDKLLSLGPTWPQFIAIFLIITAINFAIDLLSNVTTVALLRLAASSGRLWDTIVVCAADLSLTIVVFTLTFPLALVTAVLIIDGSRTTVNVTATDFADDQAEPSLMQMIEEIGPKFSGTQDLKLFVIQMSMSSGGGLATFNLWANKENKLPVLLQDFASIAKSFVKNVEVLSSDDKKAELKITFNRGRTDFGWLRPVYYAAFVQGNLVRDSFLGVVQLEPIVITYRSVFAGAVGWQESYLRGTPYRTVTVCSDGAIKTAELAKSQDAKLEPPCTIRTAAFFSDVREPERELRKATIGNGGVLITPFFLTSFASSLLYYCALILLFAGAFFLRLLERVVSVPYLDITNKPFTVLGIVLFVPALALWTLVRLIV
jgi:hypothetical protein